MHWKARPQILGARHCQQVSKLSQGSTTTTTNRIPCSINWYQEKKTLVPASAAVYICSELDAKSNIVLQEDVHLNILHVINELFMLQILRQCAC